MGQTRFVVQLSQSRFLNVLNFMAHLKHLSAKRDLASEEEVRCRGSGGILLTLEFGSTVLILRRHSHRLWSLVRLSYYSYSLFLNLFLLVEVNKYILFSGELMFCFKSYLYNG